MKKKLSIVTLLTIVMTMCFGMTAFASPKTMPDGTVFDAEYYAKTYPDVASAIGTDENALYQHYATVGKAEGRHPVAPVQTTTSTTTASSSNLDTVLATIQTRLATGAIPGKNECMADPVHWREVLKFNTDEDVESYMLPILQVCAQNGYKYRVSAIPNFTGMYSDYSPFDYCTSYSIAISNRTTSTRSSSYDSDGTDVVVISLTKYTKDYTTKGFSGMGVNIAPETHKKNDIIVEMQYNGYLVSNYSSRGNRDFHIVGEIPVN